MNDFGRETREKKETCKKNTFSILWTLIAAGILMCVSYYVGSVNSRKRIAVDLITSISDEEKGAYSFLDKNLSDYICLLCDEFKLNSDLVVSILMVENPEFDAGAIHKNANGSVDCGLFQLNDRYIWTTFSNEYWFENVELDPFNWKHNCFVAVSHLSWLKGKLKIQDDVIMAYNCGVGAVMSGNVPYSTKEYLAKVKNNLILLNEIKK